MRPRTPCTPASPQRRRLIALGALGWASLADLARAAEPSPPMPVASSERLARLLGEKRSLWLLRGDEEVRATWWSASRGYDRDEYLKIVWLMRDVQASRVMPIDRRLLDLLAGVQAWLAGNGKLGPMLVHSGYRSPATNRRTEGAALDSKHIVGKAADVSIPGLSNVKLAGMSQSLGMGGTGFYVGRGFVHVDTGDERLWIDSGRRPKSSSG
jgi:uncharacterized protein YcbK (DUF882 family)